MKKLLLATVASVSFVSAASASLLSDGIEKGKELLGDTKDAVETGVIAAKVTKKAFDIKRFGRKLTKCIQKKDAEKKANCVYNLAEKTLKNNDIPYKPEVLKFLLENEPVKSLLEKDVKDVTKFLEEKVEQIAK